MTTNSFLTLRINRQQQYWLDFLFEMTKKEIAARYANAFFGFLWIVLNPLMQMVVIGLVFQFFIKVEVDNYFLFLFTGLLPWNFFAESVKNSTSVLISDRNLVKNMKFPKEILVLSIVLSNFFHLAISMSILVLALILDKFVIELYSMPDMIVYTLRMLLIIPVFLILFLFTSGLSLFLSVKNVRYRDIQFFIQSLLALLFYATPIIYSRSLLPIALQKLLYLNPMAGIVEAFHAVLLLNTVNYLELGILGGLVTVFFVISYVVFANDSKKVGDWL